MKKVTDFFVTTFIGGILVILPLAVLFLLVNALVGSVYKLLLPVTSFLVLEYSVSSALAYIIVIASILGLCFAVGLFVRTRLGGLVYGSFERSVFKKLPGYSMLKETFGALFNKDNNPFSRVVLAKIFDNDTMVTAFQTDTHTNGYVTIFIPTGPNPTSGMIYHVKADRVYPVNILVEDAMRSIISCGNGSQKLMESIKSDPSLES